MVRISLRVTAFVTVGALLFSTPTAISTTSSAGFTASDGSLQFAINIPQKDESNALYFTMSGPSSQSWIAVGMGSNKMDKTLIFMAYSDPTGKNITLSPRLSHGNVEPSHTDNVTITILPGTTITNGNYTVNWKCNNCRSWKGGSVDATDTAAKFIFATGPDGDLKTKDLSKSVKRHGTYGAFTMDLTKALGTAGVPFPPTSDTAGTTQTQDKNDHDFSGALHACLMILAFVGLMPVGVVILRILRSPKWHGVAQAFSLFVAMIGIFLGFYISTMYNRSKKFNSAHQIIGILVMIMLIGQFALGFMHHRIYKQTQATTKLAPIHVWLGRVVITLGITNGFLGFPLALDSKYDWALLALTLLMAIVLAPIAFWRWKRDNSKAMMNGGQEPQGYQAQPWRNPSNTTSDVSLGGYPANNQGRMHPPVNMVPVQGRQFV